MQSVYSTAPAEWAIVLPPKDPFSTCPWEKTSCLLYELGIEFSVHLYLGHFECFSRLTVFSQPLRLYSQSFKLLPVGLVTRLYTLKLEWIRLLTEEVPKFISRSRNYPVILFTYSVFNHLFRSCCVCFRWPNLRKPFKLYNPNRFHVIYFSS